MRYRTLGDTGLKVSEVSLGCWAIGSDMWGPQSDTDAIMAIRKAVDLGVNLVDTSDSYGTGHSEELIAKALSGHSEKVLLATKVGHWGREEGAPLKLTNKHHIFLCCDASLYRLKAESIDIYLCDIAEPEDVDLYVEAFSELQEKGKIWYWGVSTNNFEVLQKFNQNDCCSVIELEYNALNRSAELDLLPYCRKHKIGVIVHSPLAMGKLTGKFSSETTFTEGDMRQKWIKEDKQGFQREIEKARELSAFSQNGRTLSQAALAFSLSHPDVNCVIPGAKRPDQVESNVAAAEMPLTPEELRLAHELFPL